LGGALLLLAKHEMDFFGFDVLFRIRLRIHSI
jgi:hypothetical protein